MGSDAIIESVEGSDESEFAQGAVFQLLVLSSALLLYPGGRNMENRNSASLGIDKNTLGFKLVTLGLLDGGAPFVVLRYKHSGGRRLGGKCEGGIELTSVVIVTLGEVIIKDPVVGLMDDAQLQQLFFRENGLVYLNPFNLSKTAPGNKAVVSLTSIQSGELWHWF